MLLSYIGQNGKDFLSYIFVAGYDILFLQKNIEKRLKNGKK